MLNNTDIENYLMKQDDHEQSAKKRKTFDDLTGENPDKENTLDK